MDALDFLDVANRLQDSDRESDRRTSVGRSYFALFNYARARVSNIRPIPDHVDAHLAVAHYLTRANDRNLQRVGHALGNLRISRNSADYELGAVVGINQSRAAALRAQRAVDRIDGVSEQTLRTAVAAVPRFQAPRR